MNSWIEKFSPTFRSILFFILFFDVVYAFIRQSSHSLYLYVIWVGNNKSLDDSKGWKISYYMWFAQPIADYGWLYFIYLLDSRK